jgi:very-short-patch-repair endonuclease
MSKPTYTSQLIANARALRRNMPSAERRLWFDGLSTLPWKFRRQRPVGAYIVDFYCAAAKLVIELDGATHDDELAQQRDAVRTAYLESLGLHVIRFTNDDVMKNLEAVLFEISRAVGQRAEK